MMTIVTIASSSETSMTTETILSSKEMMSIVTVVSSSKTMVTIRTMISNKEMLTTVTMVSSCDIMMTTIRNEKIITIASVFSSREAIVDNENNDWK